MYNEKYILCIKECLLSLYIVLYNNKHSCYTSSCIIRNTFYVSRNVCCHYTIRCIITIFIFYYIREYIITTNISIIHESVFLIIQDDV